MNSGDEEHCRLAVDEARKSKDEDDGRIHPKVGVVVVKDGKVLASAHRGELTSGEHAEFTVLERKLLDKSIAGATIYTTLEPCTTRNHPKVPCAERLAERKVKRVVIGMVDPNPEISGKGQRYLVDSGIELDYFPPHYSSEIEELNREFTRFYKKKGVRLSVSPEFIKEHKNRSLDDWFKSINVMYWNRNFNKSASEIFTHLVEVVGGLSLLASQKKKADINPRAFVSKALAWWMALCGRVGINSVSDLLWSKFPYACPYCQRSPHVPDICSERKRNYPGPDWGALAQIGDSKQRPSGIGDWQKMFSQLYPAQQTEEYGLSFGRLTEELGELAETIRVFQAAPGYFISEAADVFAWLMHIQNIIEQKNETPVSLRGNALAESFCSSYPDKCLDCDARVCKCPPILEGTIGRIAHEVPGPKAHFGEKGFFLTSEQMVARYQIT